jgi:cytochrome P450
MVNGTVTNRLAGTGGEMTDTLEALPDDLLVPELIADPHPAFGELRAHDPVHWSERHRAWLITRYDDCSWALSAHRELSSDRLKPLFEVMSPERREQAGPVYEMLAEWMVLSDPPQHSRLRQFAAAAFNPRRVASREGRIQALVDDLLDRFVAEGKEDLVADFTYPLPATVIGELIGAPGEDTHRFRGWSEALAQVAFGVGGEVRPDRHDVALRGLAQMFEYFEELIALRSEQPGEDMISDLLAGDGSGQRLSDAEIKSMCALMLFAGHETTTSSVASAVVTLLAHPSQLELLRSDPEAHATRAVEELLRFEGPIKVLQRTLAEDVELRGKRLRRGERAFVLPAAANRDPERFPDADRVDITRKPNPHIAFGRGVHACIGAQLARLEMRIAVAAIVVKLPGLRLAVDPSELPWEASLASRGLQALPVSHTAG